jgi:hypothetical protein
LKVNWSAAARSTCYVLDEVPAAELNDPDALPGAVETGRIVVVRRHLHGGHRHRMAADGLRGDGGQPVRHRAIVGAKDADDDGRQALRDLYRAGAPAECRALVLVPVKRHAERLLDRGCGTGELHPAGDGVDTFDGKAVPPRVLLDRLNVGGVGGLGIGQFLPAEELTRYGRVARHLSHIGRAHARAHDHRELDRLVGRNRADPGRAWLLVSFAARQRHQRRFRHVFPSS